MSVVRRSVQAMNPRSRWSTQRLRDSVKIPNKPAARMPIRSARPPVRSAPPRPNSSPATRVAIPALPSSMRAITTRRRTGCDTTLSASAVVKPAPVNAERAWNRAASRDMPVDTRAAVAILVMISPMRTMTNREKIAITPLFPTTRGPQRNGRQPPGRNTTGSVRPDGAGAGRSARWGRGEPVQSRRVGT